MPTRVLIADDHAIVRSGLTLLINSQPDMEVVGAAMDGKEAVDLSLELQPDIVLMDLSMPPGENGLTATKKLKEAAPEINVLILTMHDDEEYLFRVLHAGASGYILKNAKDMELIRAIQTVSQGAAYLYPSATKMLIQEFLNRVQKGEQLEDYHILTQREQEVLSLIAQGYTNKEIAEKLVLSVKTIESHKANIMEKLHLKTRPELVRYALKKGLLDFV
ncbi:DNA-binding response regulator [Laceyella sacchari]|jgi:two-component system response regulator NreC|uniref:Two component transcriptional regulator, LuxR family n=2 Tax=Laceyella TaxID=292635 RepID=A0AA46AF35_9BACL|nr:MULTISPECIES: response regulator transcription factor [Laceyella]AUS09002.1 DNA-binding response regulator [Laceyella sacchari]MRG28424.1 response regulator [Laceyella tengchongensis]PRZ15406.1 LuxR family two component transcriptional regulator [Laceyella sediminis]SMP16911.1 two component transcriptional regulator, LuxR family [Laceyella tengchongensis]